MLRRRRGLSASNQTLVKGATSTALDILILTDLRFPGGTSTSLVNEIRACDGYRIGVLQLDSSHLRFGRVFHPALRMLIDQGRVLLIQPGEPVTASLTIVKHPYVFAESLGGKLPVETGKVRIVCGQVPVEGTGRELYSPAAVQANCEEALGVAPVWCPVSPLVRRSLQGYAVPMDSSDWVEVINIEDWRHPISAEERSQTLEDQRPLVIGRHGREDPLKWPGSAPSISLVYPNEPDFEVRILGGAHTIASLMGELPSNWKVAAFGAIEPQEFLRGLDAFVYFPHEDLIEAFGRTVLESLATGILTVVPPHIAETFGDAVVSCSPEEVAPLLRSLRKDPQAWSERAQHGHTLVAQRFSYATHTQRIHQLIGAAQASGEESPETLRAQPSFSLIPPGLRAQRPVHLLTLLGVETREVQRALHALAAHRKVACGFHPVLVITGPVPPLAQELGIECKSITGQKTWSGEGTWPEYVMLRLRQLASTYEAWSITPFDASHPLAWITLGTVR